MWAAWAGSGECVDILIQAGADVNIQDRYGNTALDLVTYSGHDGCVDILIRAQDGLRLSYLCRASIRKHLLQMNNSDLFVAVPKLGLPKPLMKFLLQFGEILDEDDIAFLSSLVL